jgi:signal peptidase I
VVPLALAGLTVSLLGAGDPVIPEGFLGRVRFFVQDQKVPALIVFFVLFEMTIYNLRHSIPFAAELGLSGRPGLPKSRAHEFESASQLLDSTRRLLRKGSVVKGLRAEAREEVELTLTRLASAMQASEFSVDDFDHAHEAALTVSTKHLARWQANLAREYFESIFIAVAVALLLRAFLVEAFKIPSGSMLPTLQINDHIFVNKLSYGPTLPFTRARVLSSMPPDRGDIVVFEFPDPNPDNVRQDYIKRVIALPGDTLEVRDGHPVINGFHVPSCRIGNYEFTDDNGYNQSGDLFLEFLGDESYLTFFDREGATRSRQGPYRVQPGEFWVLGDNRNNSSDSRAWRHGRGAGVPFGNVKGRAMFVWMSFDEKHGGPLGVTWDRLFTNVMGKPRLPKEAAGELKKGIDRCLSERPADTTPPPPQETSHHAP